MRIRNVYVNFVGILRKRRRKLWPIFEETRVRGTPENRF